jgi:hypothetical protein
MTDDTQKDAPLLRCWLKKSWSTSKKVALWLGGIAVVLIAAYVAWLGLTSQTAAKIWAALTGWCGSIISGILNYIAAIPPLVFWGSVVVVVAMVTIFGYSLTWCMARNLQDSDWGSDTATSITFAAIAITFAAIAALALTLVLAALVLAALVLVLVLADNPKSSWYYVFRFIGAYLNYRNRIKATSTTSVVEETKE